MKTKLVLLLPAALLAAGCALGSSASNPDGRPAEASETPSLGPAPGPVCEEIWIEDKTLPDEGYGYDGCYQVEDGKWVHDAHYTDCYLDPLYAEEEGDTPSRLWEHTNGSGVLLFAFTGGGNNGYIDNGDINGTMTGFPTIDTARGVCERG